MTKQITPVQISLEQESTEAPCLINCRQGASVIYKEKYLYSKYDPERLINSLIEKTQIPENAIVLIFSPVLWLGLDNLIKKIPKSSIIVAFEFEKALYAFAKEKLPLKHKNKISFYNEDNSFDYVEQIQSGHYKKVIRLDFSGGTIFNREKYESIFSLSQSVLNQFWKNKITLVKFGRIFSKNIFKNIKNYINSIPFDKIYKTVSKPILVLGAGESLDITIQEIKNCKDNFFIIAVDQALSPLLASEIYPDAVVSVEGQQVIEKAYIGKPKNSKILLFQDMVSRSSIPEIINGQTVFFISEFSRQDFFVRLNEYSILPPVIKPLGSVGLVAFEIALRLRKDTSVKIFFSGLDFSYTPGITHARGTVSHKASLYNNSRINSIYNINAAFGTGTFFETGKNGKKIITSAALKGYSLLFSEIFSDNENVFDARESGITLNIPYCDLNSIKTENTNTNNLLDKLKKNSEKKEKAILFLKQEKNALETLKDIFTFGEESKLRNPHIPLPLEISSLLAGREYLYLHFPDDSTSTNMQSFYNRIRIELNFFLKEIETTLNRM